MDIEKYLIIYQDFKPISNMDQQLIQAAENGNLEEVQRLMEMGADPSTDNNEAIVMATINGHLEIVRLLLSDSRVSSSVDDNRAIICASTNDRVEILRLLLQESQFDPSAYDNQAIMYAMFGDEKKAVSMLLSDPRFNPFCGDNWIFRLAAEDYYPEVMEFLNKIPGMLTSTVDYYLQHDEWDNIRNLANVTGSSINEDEDLIAWGKSIGSSNLVETLTEKLRIDEENASSKVLYDEWIAAHHGYKNFS